MEALVRDIMKIGVLTCKRDDKLPAIAQAMAREDADAVIVMDDYGACGVVSQTDLVRAFPRNFELLTAQDVMSDKIISVAPEAPVTAAANIMQEESVHQLFVMHEHPGPSRPSAIVTMRAIVRAMGGLEPARLESVKPKRK